jgi:hypothetical protein
VELILTPSKDKLIWKSCPRWGDNLCESKLMLFAREC